MVSPNSSSVFFLHFGGKEGREGAWLDKGKLRELWIHLVILACSCNEQNQESNWAPVVTTHFLSIRCCRLPVLGAVSPKYKKEEEASARKRRNRGKNLFVSNFQPRVFSSTRFVFWQIFYGQVLINWGRIKETKLKPISFRQISWLRHEEGEIRAK